MTPAGPVIAVHGGAGGASRERDGDDRVDAALGALRDALAGGHAVLARGGTALDAVVEAVQILEDEPTLNAGRGAALTTDETAELDAAVADGARRVGAVACVTTVRHPVALARAVLDDGRHVLLAGRGAERLAAERGLEIVDPAWFVTTHQLDALRRARDASGGGTVGAVALDAGGHVAAATSTGGITGQRAGRIGDTPVFGAGTFADDRTCAVSATGHGEAFIRALFAARVDELVRAGRPLHDACRAALDDVGSYGGTGGCVAVGADGAVALPFTTRAMYRGWMRGDEVEVALD